MAAVQLSGPAVMAAMREILDETYGTPGQAPLSEEVAQHAFEAGTREAGITPEVSAALTQLGAIKVASTWPACLEFAGDEGRARVALAAAALHDGLLLGLKLAGGRDDDDC